MSTKLPEWIEALAFDQDIPEHPPERVVNLDDLRRAWAKRTPQPGFQALLQVARDTADHFAFTNAPLGKRARAAITEATP